MLSLGHFFDAASSQSEARGWLWNSLLLWYYDWTETGNFLLYFRFILTFFFWVVVFVSILYLGAKKVQTWNKMQQRRNRCKINPWMLETIARQGGINWTAKGIESALWPRSGSTDGFQRILPCLCSSSLSRRLCISMYLQIAALVADIGIYKYVESRKLTLNDMHLCT